jgi:hypothetical protein
MLRRKGFRGAIVKAHELAELLAGSSEVRPNGVFGAAAGMRLSRVAKVTTR